MTRALFIVFASIALFVSCPAHAMEIVVDIAGQSPPGVTQDWISSTVTTRCMAKGISLDGFVRLRVNLVTIGTVTSMDAVLENGKARAFHKDISASEGISAALDEMIASLFLEQDEQPTPKIPNAEGAGKTAVTGKDAAGVPGNVRGKDGHAIALPFIPTSMAVYGRQVFVSDAKKVYRLEGDAVKDVWKAPGSLEILRITPHDDGILVLAKTGATLKTLVIRNAKEETRWDKAVVPLGGGLISTTARVDRDLEGDRFIWERPSPLKGNPIIPPAGLDILSCTTISDDAGGTAPRLVSFNESGRLVVHDGSGIIWEDAQDAGTTPLFIEEKRARVQRSGSDASSLMPIRYFLRPRILVQGKRIITFRNDQRAGSIFPGLGLFTSWDILVYDVSGEKVSRSAARKDITGYCADIGLIDGTVAALVVEGKRSYVKFFDL